MNMSFSSANLPTTSAIGSIIRMQHQKLDNNTEKESIKTSKRSKNKQSVLLEFHTRHCHPVNEEESATELS